MEHFSLLEETFVALNADKLAGLRINLVMEFNAVNGWFALALYKMGARVKWASNDRDWLGKDSPEIMQAVAIMSEGLIEPYQIKKNAPKEHPTASFWTSLIRSLFWKELDGTVEYPDLIIDPDGLAQTVINIGVQLEKDKYVAPAKPQFQKEVSMSIRDLLVSLRKMDIENLWKNLASNVKACFIESNLALMRVYELVVNDQ